MKKHTGRVVVASLLFSTSIGLAGQARAAPSSWEMPDVKGMVLQNAWDEIVSTTGGAVVPETSSADGMPFKQINLTFWEVCKQSPSEGDEFTADAPPKLEVSRPHECKSDEADDEE